MRSTPSLAADASKVGHLFKGRFKAVPAGEQVYFREVGRYVDLNPGRVDMVKRPHDLAWSSYRAHTARTEPPAWLDSSTLHHRLAAHAPRRDGPLGYVHFVAQGIGIKVWDEALFGQIYLGGEAFVQRMQARVETPSGPDVPRV